VKPNAIGDMRYITVPFTIAWLGFKLNYELDLYKIWKEQSLSDTLKEKLYEVMTKIEHFIKSNAPGSLYGEWAKKEECWLAIKNQNFAIDLDIIKKEYEIKSSEKRKKLSEDETMNAEVEASLIRLRSIHFKTWQKIVDWGRETKHLSQYQYEMASTLSSKIRNNRNISDIERNQGETILNLVADVNPELFFDMDEYFLDDQIKKPQEVEITLELVERIVKWDKKNKRLDPYKYLFMLELSEGKKPLTDRNKFLASLNLKTVEKYGFE
jgi:hypothetical protein